MRHKNFRENGGRPVAAVHILVLYLTFATSQSRGEERVDFKLLYYQEDDDRMRVITPSFLVEKEFSANTTLKLEGVYNIISGMSPTGGPPLPRTVTTTQQVAIPAPAATVTQSTKSVKVTPTVTVRPREEEHDEREEHDGFIVQRLNALYAGVAGATPAPAPKPAPVSTTKTSSTSTAARTSSSGGSSSSTAYRSVTSTKEVPGDKVPKANADDERIGFNLELSHQMAPHTLGLKTAFSQESDYTSLGLALTDAIDFNQKNTTLTLGAGITHDTISGYFLETDETRDTVDIILGLTQVLSKKTVFNATGTLSMGNGYFTDPYKVVELNQELVPERRPDSRQRQILYLSLNHYVESLAGAIEGSFRFHRDDFGLSTQTFGLAWYQELGPHWTLRPSVRYYQQNEADFYTVRFSGSPEYYSSDYRLSALDATGFGLQMIWKPNERFSLDASVDRYVQEGTDGVTWSDAYPKATSYMLGIRLWL